MAEQCNMAVMFYHAMYTNAHQVGLKAASIQRKGKPTENVSQLGRQGVVQEPSRGRDHPHVTDGMVIP